MSSMAEKCEASVREYGLAATLAKVCLRPFGVRAARFEELHASWCDRHLGINTGGRVANGNLGGDPRSRAHATLYHAYSYGRARFAFKVYRARVPELRPRRRFIDIGCGEGRLVFYWAARGYDAMGLDFDARLVERARENQATFTRGCGRVTFLHEDARTYLLPPEPAIVTLFNPFDAVILRSFVGNNRERIANSGSVVMYLHDHHAGVLAEFGMEMTFREPSLRISFWRAHPRT